MPDQFQTYANLLVEMTLQYIPNVVLALLTLWIGFWVVRILMRGMARALGMRRVDPSLAGFLESMVSISLKALVIITVATMVGVQTTSFIAIIGAAGLAVGLSLQGSLSNFAGGVLILLFKPFQVGDFITTLTQKGTVRKIEIFSTLLKAEDGSTIILPNGSLSNNVVVNHTRHLD